MSWAGCKMEPYLRFKYDAQYGIRSSGAVDETNVYYATKMGQLIGLNLSCFPCGPSWTFSLKSYNSARPSVPFSVLIPLSERSDTRHRSNSNFHKCSRILYLGGVYSINPCTGERLWYNELPTTTSFDPIVGNDTLLFIGSSDSRLFALDSAHGRMIFNTSLSTSETGTGSPTTPVYSIRHNMVYIATEASLAKKGYKDSPSMHDGYVFGINSNTTHSGAIMWRYFPQHETSFLSAPVISDELNLLYIASTANSNVQFALHALRLDSGVEVWRFRTSSRIPACPLLNSANAVLYLAAFDGTLSALHMRDGSILWESKPSQFDSSLLSAPVLGHSPSPQGIVKPSDERLYLGTNYGTLYAINTANGGTSWKFSLSSSQAGLASSPLVSLRPITDYRIDSRNRTVRGNTAYMIVVGSLDGNIYAVSERPNPTAMPTPHPTFSPTHSQRGSGQNPPLPGNPPTIPPSLTGLFDSAMHFNLQWLLLVLLVVPIALLVWLARLCRDWLRTRGNKRSAAVQLVDLRSNAFNPLHRSMNRPPRNVPAPWEMLSEDAADAEANYGDDLDALRHDQQQEEEQEEEEAQPMLSTEMRESGSSPDR